MSAPPRIRLTALTIAIGIVFTVFAPAGVGIAAAGNEPVSSAGNQGLNVGVQQGAGSVTVSVSHNGSAVENAIVRVSANDTYAGTGDYVTDPAGTVSLPTPNETVQVTITAEAANRTGSANATLHANEGHGPSFVPVGQRIAAFVHGLQQSGGVVQIGPAMADYVTALAPAGGPPTTGPPPWVNDVADRRGPPGHAVDDTRGSDRGPPDHAGLSDETDDATDSDSEQSGPPSHAGQNGTSDSADDAEADERADSAANDDAGGPPTDEDSDNDDEDDEDEADESATNGNSGNGPPDDRGSGNGR